MAATATEHQDALPQRVRVRRDGAAAEIAMVALLAYAPGLHEIFHTSDLSGPERLFLLLWPPLVLGAAELRKAVVRHRRA
jgi:hypothetical protein